MGIIAIISSSRQAEPITMNLIDVVFSLVFYWLSVQYVVQGQIWRGSSSRERGGHQSSAGRHGNTFWGSGGVGRTSGHRLDPPPDLFRRDLTPYTEVFTDQERNILIQKDTAFAVLDFMNRTERERNCSKGATLNDYKIKLSHSSYERFASQVASTIRTANVLNNMFRTQDWSEALYTDAFYISLMRALMDSDPLLYGSIIAFDRNQYGGRDFSYYIYRSNTSGHLSSVNDIARLSRGRYALDGTKGYEWFWKQRLKDYSALLWKHQEVCTRPSSRGRPNTTMVVSTEDQGMWTAPYFDCHGSKSWLITYSVPFFGCITKDKLHFK